MRFPTHIPSFRRIAVPVSTEPRPVHARSLSDPSIVAPRVIDVDPHDSSQPDDGAAPDLTVVRPRRNSLPIAKGSYEPLAKSNQERNPHGTTNASRRNVDSADEAIAQPEHSEANAVAQREAHAPTNPARWLKKLEEFSENNLRSKSCCASRRCFQTVDFNYFIQRAREIVPADSSVRRAVLNIFRSTNGCYTFNGNEVCETFIKVGFSRSFYCTSRSASEHRSSADDSDDSASFSDSSRSRNSEEFLPDSDSPDRSEKDKVSDPLALAPASKRAYRFVNRSPRKPPKFSSSRTERWLKDADELTEANLRKKKCCRTHKSFMNVDFNFFLQRAKKRS